MTGDGKTDDIVAALADYASGFCAGDLSAETRSVVLDHIVDCLACAVAGADEEPARIARAMAADSAVAANGASVLGLADKATPEQAAFANGVMARCLDYNDTFNGRKTGGHPSDMLPAILAAAEVAGLPGRAVIGGLFVAYEVFGTLADQAPLREHGIDQGALLSLGVAGGCSAILGLDRAAVGNALSLAITTTMPLRAARAGELSMWKGCATAHAAANGLVVTRLAQRGMQGPPEPFRGVDGFLQRLPVELELSGLGMPVDGRHVVERTAIKFAPVEWGAQAPVELFLALRSQFALDDIRSITVAGYDFLVNEIGGGRGDAAAKWDPQTRETADHSLPYLLAVALTDGAVTLASFASERVRDPAIRPLMRKIAVVRDPEAKGLVPPRQPVRVTIALADGRLIEERCEYPVGHPLRPAPPGAVDAKFRALAEPAIGEPAASALLARLRDLPKADSLAGLTAALRTVPTS